MGICDTSVKALHPGVINVMTSNSWRGAHNQASGGVRGLHPISDHSQVIRRVKLAAVCKIQGNKIAKKGDIDDFATHWQFNTSPRMEWCETTATESDSKHQTVFNKVNISCTVDHVSDGFQFWMVQSWLLSVLWQSISTVLRKFHVLAALTKQTSLWKRQSDWVSEWLSEWLSEWVSDWVNEFC